ncbi:MAG: TlpA disulfide reductase family protein [Acidobacteriota bacterium]
MPTHRTPHRCAGWSRAAACLVAAALGGTVGLARGGSIAQTVRLFRDPLPVSAFTLETVDGRTIASRDLRGRVVLVNFWATWCPPCRAEIPDLVALQSTYAGRLVVLGISVDEQGVGVVERFVRSHGISYPVAMSTPALLRAFADVTSLPTTFVIDPDGRIVQRHVGPIDPARTALEIEVLAGGRSDIQVERFNPDDARRLPTTAHVTAIPGIDLSGLTPELRVKALQRLNAEWCTCGCRLSVAKCRVDDPACGVSLPLARRIVEAVSRGQ